MFHRQNYASDGISAGGLFQWKRDIGPDRANSVDPADYPRLPLFTWKGAKVYCNVADTADLADAVYDAIPAALGSVCPALPELPKISKNLNAY